MKTKLQLTPKVATKVSVKNTLVIASTGAAFLIVAFIGAFFYFNLGSSDKSYGATATITAVSSGAWFDPDTWDTGEPPVDGDVILIPADITVTINKNPNVSLDDITFHLNGLLSIAGTLQLDEDSKILIAATGDIVSSGPGNSERLIVGGYSVKGNDFDDEIISPGTITTSGPSGETLLPIVLDYFHAEPTAKQTILIEWGTVTEKNNDFFTLERSSDGKHFEEITTEEGAGDSDTKLSYSFEDKNFSAGMNYYRLKQTDFNGDFEYFKIIGVNSPNGSAAAGLSGTGGVSINKVWPNPFKDRINLTFNDDQGGDVEVLIQDSRGDIVHKEVISSYRGENTFSFNDGDRLKPGIYFINIWKNGKKHQPQRLIKM